MAKISSVELGIYSFGDLEASDHSVSPGQRLRDLVEEIVLADQVGLDVFAVGEHHRRDYAVSAPAVVLAAASTRTKKIRLSSSVTVLSSEDPVRVFQQYASIDLLSEGRAEIMAGRGSFIESFPLFGYDLQDYDELFEEHLNLLLELRNNEMISWAAGRHRAPILNRGVYPRPEQNPLPVWIAVGGTPQSVVRAGSLGLPMGIAIIGGDPSRFKPYADLYRQVCEESGQGRLPLSINSHGFIADSMKEAADAFWPGHELMMGRIGQERGWPPQTRMQFDMSTGPRGNLVMGSPEQVIEKLVWEHEIFDNERFLIQLSAGHIEHKAMMKAIELYGTVVAPAVRAATQK